MGIHNINCQAESSFFNLMACKHVLREYIRKRIMQFLYLKTPLVSKENMCDSVSLGGEARVRPWKFQLTLYSMKTSFIAWLNSLYPDQPTQSDHDLHCSLLESLGYLWQKKKPQEAV
jgi:hypothetical protein